MTSWSKIARHIRVPLGFVFAGLYVWLAKPTAVSILLGLAVAAPGLALRALASGHVRKNEQLATSGPYAYTRNPLYLGSLILASGFALASRRWWIAGGIVGLLVAIYFPVIRSEEKFLGERFPEFADYSAHVPVIIPRVPAFNGGRGGFSWQLYRKHREYNALVGSAVLALALLAKLVWMR